MKSFSAFLASWALCTIGVTLAEPTPPDPQITMQQLTSRLNLTPEQQATIAPHVETRRAKLEEVRARMGTAASRRDKRAAMQQAKQAQEEFVSQVEPVLTPQQQSEWKRIRDEARDQLKQRLRERGT